MAGASAASSGADGVQVRSYGDLQARLRAMAYDEVGASRAKVAVWTGG